MFASFSKYMGIGFACFIYDYIFKPHVQYFIIPAPALIHQGNKETVSYAGLFIYVRLFEHEFYIFNRKPYKILYSFIFVSCNSAYFAVSLKRQDILLLNILQKPFICESLWLIVVLSLPRSSCSHLRKEDMFS